GAIANLELTVDDARVLRPGGPPRPPNAAGSPGALAGDGAGNPAALPADTGGSARAAAPASQGSPSDWPPVAGTALHPDPFLGRRLLLGRGHLHARQLVEPAGAYERADRGRRGSVERRGSAGVLPGPCRVPRLDLLARPRGRHQQDGRLADQRAGRRASPR